MVVARSVPRPFPPTTPSITPCPPCSPGEPPAGVTHEVLWRLAARLSADHPRSELFGAGAEPGAGADGPRCAGCGQPWPCSGRRLAELGLKRARV